MSPNPGDSLTKHKGNKLANPQPLLTKQLAQKCGILRGAKSTSMSTRNHFTGVLDGRNIIGGSSLKGKQKAGAEHTNSAAPVEGRTMIKLTFCASSSLQPQTWARSEDHRLTRAVGDKGPKTWGMLQARCPIYRAANTSAISASSSFGFWAFKRAWLIATT
jgi:hypothetical protein